MRRIILILSMLMLCLGLTACDNSERNKSKQTNQQEVAINDSKEQMDDVNKVKTSEAIDLLIMEGEKTYSAKLYNNQTTQALVEGFPLTVDMSELNGNEKYYYLSNRLSTVSEQPGKIYTGDIMLYGDDCLVVFYETFSTSYKYTQLGYIEDAAGFVKAVGEGNVQATFMLTKDAAFAHLSLSVSTEGSSNEWLEPVTDEEYNKLK